MTWRVHWLSAARQSQGSALDFEFSFRDVIVKTKKSFIFQCHGGRDNAGKTGLFDSELHKLRLVNKDDDEPDEYLLCLEECVPQDQCQPFLQDKQRLGQLTMIKGLTAL